MQTIIFCPRSIECIFPLCPLIAGNFIILFSLCLHYAFQVCFLQRMANQKRDIMFCLLSLQPVRSFRSCPTYYSPRSGQSDGVSGCNGAAALLRKWRALSQDFMGEGWRESSGKQTSTGLDGKWHVANHRHKGVCVCVKWGSFIGKGLKGISVAVKLKEKLTACLMETKKKTSQNTVNLPV